MLEWRDAEHSDRKAMQRFRCTAESLRMEVSASGLTPVHSRMWEWQVQEHLADLRVPLGKSWMTRLGFDSMGLVGISLIQEVDRGRDYDLAACAIEQRARDGSFATADAMMEDAFGCIVQRCVDLGAEGSVRVSGQIHRDNHASKWMCDRARMRFASVDAADADFELWVRELPLPGPALFDE